MGVVQGMGRYSVWCIVCNFVSMHTQVQQVMCDSILHVRVGIAPPLTPLTPISVRACVCARVLCVLARCVCAHFYMHKENTQKQTSSSAPPCSIVINPVATMNSGVQMNFQNAAAPMHKTVHESSGFHSHTICPTPVQ